MNSRPTLAFMAFPVLVCAASAWSQTAATLREAADAIGLNFGVATNRFQVSNANSDYATALKTQFNLVVCENELKFDGTEPSIGKFNYGGGDGVYAFAAANKMKMRGHNFIWHSQAGAAQAAIHDRVSGLKVMRDHITAVTAKRKEFLKRLPGTTASILYPLARPAARREGNGLFGAFPVPVFSNGSGKAMDALGRNILVPGKGSYPGPGILPQ